MSASALLRRLSAFSRRSYLLSFCTNNPGLGPVQHLRLQLDGHRARQTV